MQTLRVESSATLNGALLSSGATVATGSAQLVISETVAGGATNVALTAAIDVSAVKGVYIVSDVALTLKTNSSSAPDNTLALAAGVPVVWATGGVGSNPLTVDVTVIYATNAGTDAAALTIVAIYDATP